VTRRWLALVLGGTLATLGPRAGLGQPVSDDRAEERARMVAQQIRARGITDQAVLDAMTRVPRHLFVPPSEQRAAYEDRPLSIGFGQTISQPYIVAYMTDVLDVSRTHKVLEIGTGSGYQAAVLAGLAGRVFSIEIVPELADRARRTLEGAGYRNVEVRAGNGYAGWPEHAPFDRIIVTAAPPAVPQALIDQLAVGGTMVVPVGTAWQTMTIVRKTERGVTDTETIPVRFVPMVGQGARDETWLDRPLGGWNARGGAIPAAPPGSGESRAALLERCGLSLRTPTGAERSLAGAGWVPFRYFDQQLRAHDIEIVGGLTGGDGMCRPTGFNVFVFVGGRFAGTLSPATMDSRADGVTGAIRILSADEVAAEYARYADADALCCPSSRVTVTFRVHRSGPGPVVMPVAIRTTRGL
jgi:protein-L-isoaspartate(D-aspartate) O-methyltransferase